LNKLVVAPTSAGARDFPILRVELQSFYEAYARALERGDLRAWTEFFCEDALYRVISLESFKQELSHATLYCDGKAMIRDRATLLGEVSYYETRQLRYFISGLSFSCADDGVIHSRANFLVVESLFDAEPQILMVGEYVDEIEKQAESFRFRKRSAVYDQYRIRTTLVYPV